MQHIEKQQILNMNSGMDMGMLDYHDKMTDIEGYTDPGPEVDENDRSAFMQLDDGAAQADDTQFASVSNSAGFNANGPTASDFAVARVNPVNDPSAGALFDNDPRALSERRSAVQAFDQDGAKKLHGDELPKAPAKSATHNPQIPGANDSVTFYGERPVFDPSNDPGGPDESITTARRVAEGERLKELENQGRGDGTTANEIRRNIDDQLYAERTILPIRFIRGMQPSIDRIGALAEKFNKEISVSYSPTQWERVKTAYEALVAHTPEGLPDAAFSKLMRDRYVEPEDGTTEEEVRARADFQLFEQTANAANAKFNNYKRKRTANEAGMPPWQKPAVKKNKNREERRRRLRQLRVKNV